MNKFILFARSRPAHVIIWMAKTKLTKATMPHVGEWLKYTANRAGLEIGGPSGVFASHLLPVYATVASLDGVNFSEDTIWEGQIEEGYSYGKGMGYQYIADGTNLHMINSEVYDFVLSSNNVEHIANPMKALFEWKRVLKPHGAIICVLPRKESNFDHKRPVTTFEHIVSDYTSGIDESDLTHLDEVLRLHDLRRDPLGGSFDEFKKRSAENVKYRAMHHHVFDLPLLTNMMDYAGLSTKLTYSTPMEHFILAVKN